jgi:hypothetical protein
MVLTYLPQNQQDIQKLTEKTLPYSEFKPETFGFPVGIAATEPLGTASLIATLIENMVLKWFGASGFKICFKDFVILFWSRNLAIDY